MKLYHGTHLLAARNAITRGLQPRGNRRNKWKDAPSRSDAVYLTTAYAPYFALSTDKKMGAILEVDSDRLDPFDLIPDEDCLEQCGRGRDHIMYPDVPEVGLKERTAWYRDNLENWANGDAWKGSINGLGTCAHLGPIPIAAIDRILVFDKAKAPFTCMMAMDPVICLANYRYCGAKYRALIKWMFGEPLEEDDPSNRPAGIGESWRLPPESERQTFRLIYECDHGHHNAAPDAPRFRAAS